MSNANANSASERAAARAAADKAAAERGAGRRAYTSRYEDTTVTFTIPRVVFELIGMASKMGGLGQSTTVYCGCCKDKTTHYEDDEVPPTPPPVG